MPINRRYKYKITEEGIERVPLEEGELEEPPSDPEYGRQENPDSDAEI